MRLPALPSAILPVAFFSVLGFLVMGYHPGAEDDAVYLAAIKSRLNPALYPHDSAFFKLQMQASVFDTAMAAFVRLTHIPLAWAELLGQLLAIVLIFWASWRILCILFDEIPARWGGLAVLSAMLTLPIAGTALYIADQYLHPRNLATALILLACLRVLERRWITAPLLLTAAILLHPMMGAFGLSFCAFLALTHSPTILAKLNRFTRTPQHALAVLPIGWILKPPPPGWVDAMRPRHCFWLYQWTWYEWLGALAPLILFYALMRWVRARGETPLARFSIAVLLFALFHQAIAMILCGPSALVVLATTEPMRYLQLVYIFLALVGGALLGRSILKAHAARWTIFLLVLNIPMFLVQRHLFAATPHIELPGAPSTNPWLQAFTWIRVNTPPDAYFAAGPQYLAAPAEDMHSFRALAEHSILADDLKDRSVLSKAPALIPEWQRQLNAQQGWDRFQLADFKQLKRNVGVEWLLLDRTPPPGLQCPWSSQQIFVCRIP
ncbi:glycosyltransferase family protein [Occallatibacter riparius]|uniref:Uncharacterized protein n=1 Tax=Occallatibacter riparius TaxID=1002689 RepID=A0A9J7BK47_9BACT|nr:hypothetical protein [Occallatibacter riparius]UWZ83039.1 hypothetical protein MOP44_21010 [Occallatibacter riparius]